MLNEFLVRYRIEEFIREAEKARLIKKAKSSREDWTKQFLTVFICRVGLISDC